MYSPEQIIIGGVFGVLLGVYPLVIETKKDQPVRGIYCFFAIILSSLIGGIIIGIFSLLVCCYVVKLKEEKEKK
jgi:hypothetical protein